jgi:hypothetical protein
MNKDIKNFKNIMWYKHGETCGLEGIELLVKMNSLTAQQVIGNIDSIKNIVNNGDLIEFEKEFTKLIEKYS